MQTYKEIADTIKQAADRLAELETKSAQQAKENMVSGVVSAMIEKGLIDEKSANEKKEELLQVADSEIAIHKKALDLIGSRPKDIASVAKKASGDSPEAALDSWIMGG